uniref:Carbamoyl phosphate synthase small chain n=1 Tax=Cyanidium sp. THAL103 TaxID=3027999 RepID=A0A9Y1MXW8_9RHOD|nr:carbamoyl-phosphate synthase arginine-specific small subunit [Cyanidium sp. THAL103]
MNKLKQSILLLSDGSFYKGFSYSKPMTISGEVVFNTSMTGYQEIITDPSYKGQIVIFASPEIGNTGINNDDNESSRSNVTAIVVRNIDRFFSNWRASVNLFSLLDNYNIFEMHGLDTRHLVKHIRSNRSMNGILSNCIFDLKVLENELNKTAQMKGLDLVSCVTTKVIYEWNFKTSCGWEYGSSLNINSINLKLRIVVLDLGVKHNILRRLKNYGCCVFVVPSTTIISDILSLKPDGILLSNGPGDPSALTHVIKIVQNLLNYGIPILGICMGHQILALSLNARTFKLKFGHRGSNHPVGKKNRIVITSQNHGFAVDPDSLALNNIDILNWNFNDNTLAGIFDKKSLYFSVQYHPEGSPGPHDSDYIFNYFIKVLIAKKMSRLA